jgi:hypothetical protein
MLLLGCATKSVEAFIPEVAELAPQTSKTLEVHAVQTSLAIAAYADQSGLAQHLEVLACGRLSHPRPGRELANGKLTIEYQPEHRATSGMSDRLQWVSHPGCILPLMHISCSADTTSEGKGASMTTEATQQTARCYFDAWTTGDGETVRSVLAEDFRWVSGEMAIEGRDTFLNTGAFPSDATTDMVADAYQGEIGFQLYEAKRGDRTVRIVEQLMVRDGLITSSTFVTDMTAFMAFTAD